MEGNMEITQTEFFQKISMALKGIEYAMRGQMWGKPFGIGNAYPGRGIFIVGERNECVLIRQRNDGKAEIVDFLLVRTRGTNLGNKVLTMLADKEEISSTRSVRRLSQSAWKRNRNLFPDDCDHAVVCTRCGEMLGFDLADVSYLEGIQEKIVHFINKHLKEDTDCSIDSFEVWQNNNGDIIKDEPATRLIKMSCHE